MLTVSHWYDEVWYPGLVVNNIPFGLITDGEWDRILVVVQPSFKVGYLVTEGQDGQGILVFPFSYGGSEALGNVEDGNWVVLVELHHRFGRAGGDGSRRGRGGPNGGQQVKGCLDHSVDGDGRHFLGAVRVMVGARVVLAKVRVHKGMVWWLVIDPQEEELLGL
jgi:hypothetical protein